MDDEARQRIEMLERRINEAHDKIEQWSGRLDDVKKTVTRWQNRLSRLFHYFKIGIDEEDARAPTRKRS